MNWPELITALVAAASGIITLWFNLRGKAKRDDLNAKITLIQAETAAARERAEFAALGVAASRDERHVQFSALNEKVDKNIEVNQAALTSAGEAANLANNTNKKIADLNETVARQQSEILSLRRLQASASTSPPPEG